MVFVVGGVIIGFVIAFRMLLEGLDDDFFFTAFFSLLLGIFGGLIGTIPPIVLGLFVPEHTVLAQTYHLVSLHDSVGITGNFFLGSGTIGETVTYEYFYATANGGFKADTKKVNDDVTIFEEDRQDGILEQFTNEPKKSILNGWFAFSLDGATRYEFHIPKGSLDQNFKLQ